MRTVRQAEVERALADRRGLVGYEVRDLRPGSRRKGLAQQCMHQRREYVPENFDCEEHDARWNHHEKSKANRKDCESL